MTLPFVRPDKGGDFFTPRDHPEWLGKLLIVRPNRVIQTDFGDGEGMKDQVESYVVFVDLTDAATGLPTVSENMTIGGRLLVTQLKNRIGDLVLGRLMQKPPQGSKSGAYCLNTEYSDADGQYAYGYVQRFPIPDIPVRNVFAAPVPDQGPPPFGGAPAPQWGVQGGVPPQSPPQTWGPTTPQPPAPQPAPVVTPPPNPQVWQGGPAPSPAVPSIAEMVAFLATQGVHATPDMTAETITMIYNSFPKS